jgi:hypothetical protein
VSDIDQRLAALDPAAQPYQHPNLDALISRVTSEPRSTPRRLWRNLEVKIAGAVVAGSLVAAGTLAILQGGPALAPLALQSPTQKLAAASPYSSALTIAHHYSFRAGTTLSSHAPSAVSYRLAIPKDGAEEASHVASIFGVVGSPVNTDGNGSDWTIKSSSGRALDYENTGVPQWYYSSTSPAIAPAAASSTPVNPVPSPKVVAADVRRYLARLGFSYGVTSPQFSTVTSSGVSANGDGQVLSSTEDVTYAVTVHGVVTDQTVSFSVGEHNVVANASGPAFSVAATYRYPLEPPAAGVAQLNAAQQDITTPKVSRRAISTVTLEHSALELHTYELTNGSWWLLPEYRYQGTIQSTSGVTSYGVWSELAIDRSYVKVNNAATGSTP